MLVTEANTAIAPSAWTDPSSLLTGVRIGHHRNRGDRVVERHQRCVAAGAIRSGSLEADERRQHQGEEHREGFSRSRASSAARAQRYRSTGAFPAILIGSPRRCSVTGPRSCGAHLSRNKLRGLLTGAAIALAIALVCFLATNADAWTGVLDAVAPNTRIVVHDEAGVVYWMPYAYMQKIRAMRGVVGAASWTWFGGIYRSNEGVSFPSLAVEPRRAPVWYGRIGRSTRRVGRIRAPARWRDRRRGTMERYGWKPGDRITLDSKDWRLALRSRSSARSRSCARPTSASSANISTRRWRRAAGTRRGGHDLAARRRSRSSPTSLMREIDETFPQQRVADASETEKSFYKGNFQALEGWALLITVVTALVAVCIVFIAANTASMTVRERMREIAILKAIGFSRRRIFGMLVAEATLPRRWRGALGAGASLGSPGSAGGGVGRLEPAARPLSWFNRHRYDPGRGIIPLVLRRNALGRVPSWARAPRRRADAARSVLVLARHSARHSGTLGPRACRECPLDSTRGRLPGLPPRCDEVRAHRPRLAHDRARKFVALMGPSGSGQVDAADLLAGLDARVRPRDGGGARLERAVGGRAREFPAPARRLHLPVFNLIPGALGARERGAAAAVDPARQGRAPRARQYAAARVGLAERADHMPGEM